MQRSRCLRLSGLGLMTAALAFLVFLGGHLSAQTPPLISAAAPETIEAEPRLLAGRNGDVFRLWYRKVMDTGAGGTVLAKASPGASFQTLVEIVPTEKDVLAGSAHLAVGAAGELRVAYQWWRRTPSSKQIRLARSDDGGKTWTQPPTPLDTWGKGFSPKVGWGRGRNLVVVWADEHRNYRAWDIYARHSPDGGTTWGPEQLLSRFPQHTPTDLYARPELISDDQNRVWTVWVGLRSGRSRLYLNRSMDGGQTWTDPVELSGESQSVYGQRVVRSGERLLVVWTDKRTGRERLFSVASSDGGVTWTAPTRVDHMPSSQSDAVAPAVVMSPAGEVIVAWHDGRHGRDDIFVGRSVDGGRTWESQDVRLDMDEPGVGVSRFPSIARAPDGRLAVAWEDDRAGYDGVYLRVRSGGDQPAWGPEMLIEPPPGPKKAAKMPVVLWGADGSLHVAWEVWDFARGPLAVTRRIDGRTLAFDKK